METAVQNLLRKINYIEVELELQKQILFSIPSDQQNDIEHVLRTIADGKNQILELREEIKGISPVEYQNIVNIENGIIQFKKVVAEKKLKDIENMSINSACTLKCTDGREFSCLLKASDDEGNWTILTTEGTIMMIPQQEIDSGKP